MRCSTCFKTIKCKNKQHNLEKRQCAKCHYLGQIAAYPGGKKPMEILV